MTTNQAKLDWLATASQTDPATLEWHICPAEDTGHGVEVARLADGGAAVRHSAHPDVILWFDEHEWDAFVAGVLAGEFDPHPDETLVA